MSASAHAETWERRLIREGMASLDFDDGAGGIKVGNRGSGKLLDEGRAFARGTAAEAMETRRAQFADQRYMTLSDEPVYRLWASGLSVRQIAKRTGLNRGAVYRKVRRFKATGHPGVSVGELLSACEPAVVVMFFGLLERALEAPGEVRALIGRARAVPEIRALLEPDEVRDG